ncbi:MAG: 30S ribosomal protein S8 [bacterium]
MVDPISQIIIHIKNANVAGKATTTLPYSKLKESILEVLKREGFIKDYSKKGKKVSKTLEIELIYVDGKAKIEGVQQISKQSRRTYTKAKEIKSVLNGYGALILTTPNGIMTDRQARKEKVGGEVLFKIW